MREVGQNPKITLAELQRSFVEMVPEEQSSLHPFINLGFLARLKPFLQTVCIKTPKGRTECETKIELFGLKWMCGGNQALLITNPTPPQQ